MLRELKRAYAIGKDGFLAFYSLALGLIILYFAMKGLYPRKCVQYGVSIAALSQIFACSSFLIFFVSKKDILMYESTLPYNWLTMFFLRVLMASLFGVTVFIFLNFVVYQYDAFFIWIPYLIFGYFCTGLFTVYSQIVPRVIVYFLLSFLVIIVISVIFMTGAFRIIASSFVISSFDYIYILIALFLLPFLLSMLTRNFHRKVILRYFRLALVLILLVVVSGNVYFSLKGPYSFIHYTFIDGKVYFHKSQDNSLGVSTSVYDLEKGQIVKSIAYKNIFYYLDNENYIEYRLKYSDFFNGIVNLVIKTSSDKYDIQSAKFGMPYRLLDETKGLRTALLFVDNDILYRLELSSFRLFTVLEGIGFTEVGSKRLLEFTKDGERYCTDISGGYVKAETDIFPCIFPGGKRYLFDNTRKIIMKENGEEFYKFKNDRAYWSNYSFIDEKIRKTIVDDQIVVLPIRAYVIGEYYYLKNDKTLSMYSITGKPIFKIGEEILGEMNINLYTKIVNLNDNFYIISKKEERIKPFLPRIMTKTIQKNDIYIYKVEDGKVSLYDHLKF